MYVYMFMWWQGDGQASKKSIHKRDHHGKEKIEEEQKHKVTIKKLKSEGK